MVFLTTRGGFYTGDPMEMGSRYLDALHTFFGIGRYDCVAADGMDIAGFDGKASLEKARAQARTLAKTY
jgi:FMN-dependent NADH-azoreductase